MNAPTLLLVNADDFGFTADVNAGILEAFQRGIVRSTTLMARGAAFDDAVRLARAHPDLDVGCHLMLVQGPGLPAELPGLILALARRRLRVYDELARQVGRVLDAGICPTHLDTHKHTHLLWPPVLAAVCRLAREFGIPWVRKPVLGRPRGCRTTDHFAGLRLTGRLDAAALLRVIRRLRSGTTELMCHPGHCGPELLAAPTRLKASRQRELEALCAPEVREALDENQVQLVSFRDL